MLQPQGGQAPAYLSNGVIGLRIGPIPLPGGTALLDSFVGRAATISSEALAPAPYPLGCDVLIGAVNLRERPDLTRFMSQTYDFSNGELESCFEFCAGDVKLRVEALQFCSRTLPTIALQEVRFQVERPCRLTVRAVLDPSDLPGCARGHWMPGGVADAVLWWECHGSLSTCGAAMLSQWQGGVPQTRRNNWGPETDRFLREYVVEAVPGQWYTLRQYGCLVAGALHAEPHWQAMRLIEIATSRGFDMLREENGAAWSDLWRARPCLIGADAKWQEAADSAFFYLHSSVHASTSGSVPPFGLSRHDLYHGHIFWDTETFIFPPILLGNPAAARSLLDYRTTRLKAARDNAALNGYAGLQFPWQSGHSGCEVTTIWATGGALEQHVNFDVALAFAQYANATGDEIFRRESAWPVLLGVARWTESRVQRTVRGYEIRGVTGIDESRPNVNNEAYTNIMARLTLREACRCARSLGYEAPPHWETIARDLYIPISPQGHILKHDAFDEATAGPQISPDPLAAYFPYGYSHDAATDAATRRYYLGHARSYLGMPMMSALLGVSAARSGERECSLEYFEAGVMGFIREPFSGRSEVSYTRSEQCSGPEATVFLTNSAGFLQSLYLGLTGIHIGEGEPKEWAWQPVAMPTGWEAIEVERLWARGQEWRLSARHGASRAELTRLS